MWDRTANGKVSLVRTDGRVIDREDGREDGGLRRPVTVHEVNVWIGFKEPPRGGDRYAFPSHQDQPQGCEEIQVLLHEHGEQ